ncbi:hypothetical protein HOY82DRAFT_543119 [Tuber indicum]|nr:hypothetical protein HOY82DRAFT_543119 [Tuber indicum]
MDYAILDYKEAEEIENWTIQQYWILTTHYVADAFYTFHSEKHDIITRSFRKVGLSLPVDGSQDQELDIKGFEGLEIGNWREIPESLVPFADIRTAKDNSEEGEFCVDLEKHDD